MGIVKKQSIIGSVFVYLGAILGFITSALLFPKFLSPQEIGLLSLLVTYSLLFSQIASAGFLNTITRMFPYFRNNDKKHNGFLFLTLTVVSIASLLMIVVFYLIKDYLVLNNSAENSLFAEYSYLVIPLFIFINFFNILDYYTKALFNATRGIVVKEVWLRVLILIIFVFYFLQNITFKQFVELYVLAYGAIMIYLIIMLIYEKQFSLKPDSTLLTPNMKKELIKVSSYGILISAVGYIILNIDRVMLEKMLVEDPIGKVGIYTTCTYFATMVILPSRPLLKITSTIVAEAWRRDDMSEMQMVYYKSTLNQLIIGILVFIGIWINIDNIFKIIPPIYEEGKWVIFYIGLFYLTDMALGANRNIISNSPKYAFLSHITIGLIVLTIITNLIFIPSYGITGAAFASLIARIIFNYASWWYVKKQYKLEAFNIKHLWVVLIALASYSIVYLIPDFSNYVLDILIKSTAIFILFVGLIVLFKVSEDIQIIVKNIRNQIFRK